MAGNVRAAFGAEELQDDARGGRVHELGVDEKVVSRRSGVEEQRWVLTWRLSPFQLEPSCHR